MTTERRRRRRALIQSEGCRDLDGIDHCFGARPRLAAGCAMAQHDAVRCQHLPVPEASILSDAIAQLQRQRPSRDQPIRDRKAVPGTLARTPIVSRRCVRPPLFAVSHRGMLAAPGRMKREYAQSPSEATEARARRLAMSQNVAKLQCFVRLRLGLVKRAH